MREWIIVKGAIAFPGLDISEVEAELRLAELAGEFPRGPARYLWALRHLGKVEVDVLFLDPEFLDYLLLCMQRRLRRRAARV